MGINGSKETYHEPFQYNSTNNSPEANELLYNKLITAVFSESPLGESDPQTGFNESVHTLLTDNSNASTYDEKNIVVQNDLKTFNYRKLASHVVFLLNDFDNSNLSVKYENLLLIIYYLLIFNRNYKKRILLYRFLKGQQS